MDSTGTNTICRRALCFTPMETDRQLIVDAAVRAEQLGFEAVIVPEGWGYDSGVLLTEIATRTERIRLVAGIQSIWGRTPAQLAMQAVTLAEVSGGRFVLGLGASTPELAAGLHGQAFERPADRLADTVATIRTLLDGERIDGTNGRRGLRLGVTSEHRIPIWIAGLGPRTTEFALEHADGWFPAFVPVSQLVDPAGGVPSSSDCELVLGPATVVAEDPSVARMIVQQLVGWYLSGMGRLYGDRLSEAGFAKEVAHLRLANPAPRPGQLVWPDEADGLLDELAAHGTAEQVARTLAVWDRAVDLVSIVVPPGIGAGVLDAVEAAAPPTPAAIPIPA